MSCLSILESIRCHKDLLRLDEQQRKCLCGEIREFLIDSVSKTGGHLASNLGVVELTVAIETVFNTSEDRLVFDVGHQSYVHKLLTGRQTDFSTLRQFGGIAGFPKPGESVADAFVAGHASSSVSVALGMARARSLSGENYHVVALLGDGAATGGMVYEGLNDAAVSNEPMVVILNDNAMSIDRNVGGMARHLSRLRTKEKYLNMKEWYRDALNRLPGGKPVYRFTRKIKDRIRRALIPTTIFEAMGMTYLGPVDGHDTENLIALLTAAKEMGRPVLVHVMTQKGRGYQPAEENPSKYHGVGRFDPEEGITGGTSGLTFSEAFGSQMCRLAEKEPKLCAITAAMPGGTGLLNMKKQYPKRLFDVGIAEEHAVSMAGGMAKQGLIPVVALYSTFLQRSYDMILQDVAMLKLPVILAVDRAGLVGEDGETHHGVFDVGFLRQIPGMRVLCPCSCAELQQMLSWAVKEKPGPVAIRYPRGTDRGYSDSNWHGEGNTVVCHRNGKDITILTYGTLLANAMEAAELLHRQGVEATVLRLMSIGKMPVQEIAAKMAQQKPVYVMEEVSGGCGIRDALGQQLRSMLPDCVVCGVDLGSNFVTHGRIEQLYGQHGLDGQSVCHSVLEVLGLEN